MYQLFKFTQKKKSINCLKSIIKKDYLRSISQKEKNMCIYIYIYIFFFFLYGITNWGYWICGYMKWNWDLGVGDKRGTEEQSGKLDDTCEGGHVCH